VEWAYELHLHWVLLPPTAAWPIRGPPWLCHPSHPGQLQQQTHSARTSPGCNSRPTAPGLPPKFVFWAVCVLAWPHGGKVVAVAAACWYTAHLLQP
jgi:hypothetical protein